MMITLLTLGKRLSAILSGKAQVNEVANRGGAEDYTVTILHSGASIDTPENEVLQRIQFFQTINLLSLVGLGYFIDMLGHSFGVPVLTRSLVLVRTQRSLATTLAS